MEEKVLQGFPNYYLDLLFWAQITAGEQEHQLFSMTRFIRKILIQHLSLSTISLHQDSIQGIHIDGQPLMKICARNDFRFNYNKVVDYLVRKTRDKNDILSYMAENNGLVNDYLFISKGNIDNFVLLNITTKKADNLLFKISEKNIQNTFKQVAS